MTAFERMRKQRDERIKRQFRAEAARMRLEFEELDRRSRAEQREWEEAEFERKQKADLDRIIFDAGMTAWGVDLQTCLFHPKPHKVPMPPVYGGEPYKMMEVERP